MVLRHLGHSSGAAGSGPAGPGSGSPRDPLPAELRPSSTRRRTELLELLSGGSDPLAGETLAEHFGVSRQAIVHDIAVLRAEGAPILATVRGYLLAGTADRLAHRAVVTVRHRPDEAEDELLSLVDAGVRVVDVIVEHPVYGELRGDLHLSSPADVREWAASARRAGVRFLSELTDGVHLHTLEAESEAALARARKRLAERGYLVLDAEDDA